MRNQEGQEDNYVYFEDEDGEVQDDADINTDKQHSSMERGELAGTTAQADKHTTDKKSPKVPDVNPNQRIDCITNEDNSKKANSSVKNAFAKNDEFEDMMNGRKDTNDFMIFNDRRNTNELGELDILNLDLNVFQDDILKSKKDDKYRFKFGTNKDTNHNVDTNLDSNIWKDGVEAKNTGNKAHNYDKLDSLASN